MFRYILLVALGLSFTAAQHDRTARIVGGRPAGVGEVSYQVSLRAFGSTFHFCGGALISNRWTVTAGTCVHGRARNSLHVVAGSVALSTNGVSRRSSNIITHHLFHPSSIDNNIALVQSGAFPLNQNIWPIPLSSTILRFPVGATISGFGATDLNGGGNSERLQVLFVVTAFDLDCGNEYKELNLEVNFCTNNIEEGQGFCSSDLGGPLVSNGELIGIANWNLPCAQGNRDIYVRISHFRLWIGGIAGI